MADYMNEQRPPVIPARSGGEPRRVLVRLVRLDGTEEHLPGRSVRYVADSHVMVAVRSPTEYLWLRTRDVSFLE